MKKKILILLNIIVVNIFFLRFMSLNVYADETDFCNSVGISIKPLNYPQYVESRIILPTDSEIKIRIPWDENYDLLNLQKETRQFGLYASYTDKNGDKIGWVRDGNGGLLIGKEIHDNNDNALYFTIDKNDYIVPDVFLGNLSEMKIIPSSEDEISWSTNSVEFKIVYDYNLERREDLFTACKFTIERSNRCSSYPGYNIERNNDDFTLTFGKSVRFPSDDDNPTYYLSRFYTPNNKFFVKNKIDDEMVSITFNSSEEPSFFDTKSDLILYNSNNNSPIPICEFTVLPMDKQYQEEIENCSITPIMENGENGENGIFRGEIKIENYPKRMLTPHVQGWSNIGYQTWGNEFQISIIPKLVVIKQKNNEDDAISKNLISTGISGIEFINTEDWRELCNNNVNACMVLSINDSQQVLQMRNVPAGPPGSNNYNAYLIYESTIRSGTDIATSGDSSTYMVSACSTKFTINPEEGATNFESITPLPTVPPPDEPTPVPIEIEKICTGHDNNNECKNCVGKGWAYTAFGCIPTDIQGFFNIVLFKIGLGIGGGVAFLLMLWGSFTMLISGGDPQKIQQAREIIVSAVAGILLIIFSVFIARFIGADILKIPGFSYSVPSPTPPPSTPTPTPTPTTTLSSPASGDT